MDTTFDVETFLRSLRATKPPWECPKCQKVYKSYSGMEYHLQNFDHTSLGASGTPNKPASARKSKLKFTKRKKGHRFNRRSPSPSEFFYQTRETLTWAEAQRMVEVESEGRVYRFDLIDFNNCNKSCWLPVLPQWYLLLCSKIYICLKILTCPFC